MDWIWRTETSKLHFTIFTQRSEASLHCTPSESPKVMGLMGIHDPDSLCHFSGITYCPRCREEGQNEGTMVNPLWTMHYRLGLVSNRCYDCWSTTSDTLCCHGWHNCCQLGRMFPLSQFHLGSLQESTTASAENPHKEVKTEWST